jgi:hypothetical protein
MHDGLRADYSGRGMYGDKCLGYTGDEPLLFMHDLARLLAERDSDRQIYADDIRYELERIGHFNSDSMGFGTIFYLPAVEVEGVEDDDEDDDEE